MESEEEVICSDMSVFFVVVGVEYFEDVSVGHVDEYCEYNLVDDLVAFNDDDVLLSKKDLKHNFECNGGCVCCV